MNRSAFWIGTLLFSAIIMAVMLVALPPLNRPAYAENVNQGAYRLFTPGHGSAPEGLVSVLTSDGKMITYQLQTGTPGRFMIKGFRDLSRDLTVPVKP
ncbi:MAG: hypothetical protein WCI73_09175 [Phycisphaerae bacterium]